MHLVTGELKTLALHNLKTAHCRLSFAAHGFSICWLPTSSAEACTFTCTKRHTLSELCCLTRGRFSLAATGTSSCKAAASRYGLDARRSWCPGWPRACSSALTQSSCRAGLFPTLSVNWKFFWCQDSDPVLAA